jgi:hypothetical protein
MQEKPSFFERPLNILGVEFPFKLGIRLFKCRFKQSPIPELEGIWSRIEPMTFAEINRLFPSIAQKRAAFECMGLETMLRDLNPVKVSAESLLKTTSWVQPDGSIIQHSFTDTYEIHRVNAFDLWGDQHPHNASREQLGNVYFVKCRDTSTGKEYVIWVDLISIYQINARMRNKNGIVTTNSRMNFEKLVTPIEAIAWTIMTDIPYGSIEYILRQGDCIFVRPSADCKKQIFPRHLTGKEYVELMKGES